jgi:hypothetical protein
MTVLTYFKLQRAGSIRVKGVEDQHLQFQQGGLGISQHIGSVAADLQD